MNKSDSVIESVFFEVGVGFLNINLSSFELLMVKTESHFVMLSAPPVENQPMSCIGCM
jgi:hypothetical protein